MSHRIDAFTRMLAIVALALCVAAPSFALDLDEARNQGLIGEQADGYVGVVAPNPSGEVVKLAEYVNSRRKAGYEKIAAGNGVPVGAVAALQGKEQIEKAPSGQWVNPGSGWLKKH